MTVLGAAVPQAPLRRSLIPYPKLSRYLQSYKEAVPLSNGQETASGGQIDVLRSQFLGCISKPRILQSHELKRNDVCFSRLLYKLLSFF